VRGSVLSLSFVDPTNGTDQRDQMDQIPATRREMVRVTHSRLWFRPRCKVKN
jgi:hypothetical protein